MRKSRGDGNCFYRAIYVQFIEFLMTHFDSPRVLKLFIHLLISEDGIFSTSLYGKEFKELYKPVVLGFLYQLANFDESAKESKFTLFQKMILFNKNFDYGMCQLFRLMLANFVI